MRPPDLTRPPTSPRHRSGLVRRRLVAAASFGGRFESATTILGPAHPLTRAIEAVAVATRQWRVTAAILAGASIAHLEGHPWATSLAISAGIVLLALTTLLAALKQRVRDRATDLIAEDRETLPIATVQRQRQRLLTRRRRKTLARTLDTMVRQATNPPAIYLTGARPLFDIRVIAAVAHDLSVVATLLQDQHSRAQGVAVIERLITDGGSPLYTADEIRLRQELNRLRRLLAE